jgi:hypothetical protein
MRPISRKDVFFGLRVDIINLEVEEVLINSPRRYFCRFRARMPQKISDFLK